MPEVAISLSGGGYRASVFHLGVLSYLNRLKLKDGQKEHFLDFVKIMSTVSGGTITGLWYLLNESKKQDRKKTFSELYKILTDNNLAENVLSAVNETKNSKDLSVIKELSNAYDNLFFHGATFGEIMDYAEKIDGIHHYAAYATDMDFSQPFLFQATKDCDGFDNIGSNKHIIEREDARDIKLADILASSSCFPIVFEPMLFPTDFFSKEEPREALSMIEEYRLMDGGIIDNQGIDYFLRAESHLEKTRLQDQTDNCIDLAIISDAAYSEPFKKKNNDNTDKWRIPKWLNRFIQFFNIKRRLSNFLSTMTVVSLVIILSIILTCLSCSHYFWFESIQPYGNIILGVSEGIFGTLLLITLVMWKYIPIKKNKGSEFEMPTGLPWKIRISQYIKMSKLRFDSVLQMVNTVMMSHMRKVNIKVLTQNPKWINRFVIINIGFFRHEGEWKKYSDDGSLSELEKIWEIADLASSHKTKLWFSKEDLHPEKRKEKKDNLDNIPIPEAILACGQFTACWQLLHWVKCSRKNRKNQDKEHRYLKEYEKVLDHDWEQFKSNPRKYLYLFKTK